MLSSPSQLLRDLKLSRFLEQRIHDLAQVPKVLTQVKVVVDPGYQDGLDLDYAREVINLSARYRMPPLEVAISVVTYPTDTRDDIIERYKDVQDWAKDAAFVRDPIVLPQLHAVTHGHIRAI